MKFDSIEVFSILGVPICDTTRAEALGYIEYCISDRTTPTTTVYFVNTNSLNLTSTDRAYADVLRRGDLVFGDGIGVRWASRILRGVAPRDNVNGTDLVPMMFSELAGRGHRYYLLGATSDVIARAADYARAHFGGWECVGAHHGYVHDFSADDRESLLRDIRESSADVLLVGMGNPLQETWIDRNRQELDVPVALAIGGLFAYWSGDLDRAPRWMRILGIEWLYLMFRQPRKIPRYVFGNPAFIFRIACARLRLRSNNGSG